MFRTWSIAGTTVEPNVCAAQGCRTEETNRDSRFRVDGRAEQGLGPSPGRDHSPVLGKLHFLVSAFAYNHLVFVAEQLSQILPF